MILLCHCTALVVHLVRITSEGSAAAVLFETHSPPDDGLISSCGRAGQVCMVNGSLFLAVECSGVDTLLRLGRWIAGGWGYRIGGCLLWSLLPV